MIKRGQTSKYMRPSYRGTRPRAVDAKWPRKSPFSPLHTPRIWPSCAADGAIRTALALPLRGASPCSSEPPQARTATRSLARTTHLPDLPAICWLRLPHPYSITSAAPLALTYLKWPVEQLSHWPVTGKSDIKRLRARCQFRASWRAYSPPGHAPRRRTFVGSVCTWVTGQGHNEPGESRAVGWRATACCSSTALRRTTRSGRTSQPHPPSWHSGQAMSAARAGRWPRWSSWMSLPRLEARPAGGAEGLTEDASASRRPRAPRWPCERCPR